MRPIATCLTIALVCLVEPAAARAQTASSAEPASLRVRALEAQLKNRNPGALDTFWESVKREGAPLIEMMGSDSALVTFVYRGADSTRNAVLFGGPASSLTMSENALQHLEGSNLWFRSFAVRRDARFQYKLAENADLSAIDLKDMAKAMQRLGAFRLDPLNPRRFPTDVARVPAIYANSVVELAGAPAQPWITRRAGVAAGALLDTTFTSAVMKNQRTLTVYTPPGYARTAGPYDLLIVFDREAYLNLVPTPTILDNLIADRRIPPVVALLIGNPGQSRSAELPCNRSFADFLAGELVPWARQHYAITDDAARTTVAGSSYGGLASTCSALFHPERFGNVLSQSGSYWWGPDTTSWKEPEWVLKEFTARDRLPLRFYQDVGLMESGPTRGDAPSMVVSNRHLRDLLRSKGYEVHYAEFNGAHEYLNWQGTLADGLIALLGARAH